MPPPGQDLICKLTGVNKFLKSEGMERRPIKTHRNVMVPLEGKRPKTFIGQIKNIKEQHQGSPSKHFCYVGNPNAIPREEPTMFPVSHEKSSREDRSSYYPMSSRDGLKLIEVKPRSSHKKDKRSHIMIPGHYGPSSLKNGRPSHGEIKAVRQTLGSCEGFVHGRENRDTIKRIHRALNDLQDPYTRSSERRECIQDISGGLEALKRGGNKAFKDRSDSDDSVSEAGDDSSDDGRSKSRYKSSSRRHKSEHEFTEEQLKARDLEIGRKAFDQGRAQGVQLGHADGFKQGQGQGHMAGRLHLHETRAEQEARRPLAPQHGYGQPQPYGPPPPQGYH